MTKVSKIFLRKCRFFTNIFTATPITWSFFNIFSIRFFSVHFRGVCASLFYHPFYIYFYSCSLWLAIQLNLSLDNFWRNPELSRDHHSIYKFKFFYKLNFIYYLENIVSINLFYNKKIQNRTDVSYILLNSWTKWFHIFLGKILEYHVRDVH